MRVFIHNILENLVVCEKVCKFATVFTKKHNNNNAITDNKHIIFIATSGHGKLWTGQLCSNCEYFGT